MLKNDLVRIGLIILAGILLLQLLNRSASKHNNVNEEVESPETYGNVDEQEYFDGHEDEDENQNELFSQPEDDDGNEDYTDYHADEGNVEQFDDKKDSEPSVEKESASVGSYDMSDDNAATVPSSAAQVPERPRDCFPKDTLTSEDLLPKDKYSKWAEVNPEGQGELKDRNFNFWMALWYQYCWSIIKKRKLTITFRTSKSSSQSIPMVTIYYWS